MTINHSPCRWKQDIALSRFGRDYDVTTTFRSCFVVFFEVATTSYITRSLGDSDKRSWAFFPVTYQSIIFESYGRYFFLKIIETAGKTKHLVKCFTPTLSKLKTCSFMIVMLSYVADIDFIDVRTQVIWSWRSKGL